MEKQDFHKIFFYEFKLGRSAAHTARNISEVWGEGSANEHTVQHWFKKFRNGDVSLEDHEGRGRHPVVDDDQLKALVEASPRTTVRELAKS